MKSPVGKIYFYCGDGGGVKKFYLYSISITWMYRFPLLTAPTVLVRDTVKRTVVSSIVFVVHVDTSGPIKVFFGITQPQQHTNIKFSISSSDKHECTSQLRHLCFPLQADCGGSASWGSHPSHGISRQARASCFLVMEESRTSFSMATCQVPANSSLV